jgi:F-type H+-transporting ATPase subunit gamma
MKQQRRLRDRLRTLDTLHEAVSAMKSLSAHQFRVARQALPAARAYRDRVSRTIDEIQLPEPVELGGAIGLFIVSTDLGLCGDYNARMADAAKQMGLPSQSPVYCVGRRGVGALRAMDLVPRQVYTSAASVETLPGLLLDVSEDLLRDYTAGRFRRLMLLAAQFEGAGRFTPQVTQLLPIHPARRISPTRPTRYASRESIVAVAVREYLFIALYESLLDALAAEHGMRLVATESAEDWVRRSIRGVRQQMAAQQREATTQELLDLIGGRGLPSDDPSKPS